MKRFNRAEAPPSADAARVGEELRDAREASGLSIEDMSQALRIRRVYLVALEEGRMRDLPSPAYAWGFVRNYANALGLDADEMVRRFRDSAGPAVPRRHDLIFPEPVPERGMPTGILVLVGAVLAIGAYIGWLNWSSPSNRTVDAIPAVPPGVAAPPMGMPTTCTAAQVGVKVQEASGMAMEGEWLTRRRECREGSR
jgi:cytoskeleton protein RodZ